MKKNTQNGRILDVTIEKLVPNGYGLAFAENLTVFVSLAAVGDRLRVKLNQLKGKIAFAEIVEILEPSKDRRKPPCAHFGLCGGCDFQQMDYAAQLRAKTAIIRDCLRRIGKMDYQSEIEILASPQEFAYRARAQWHADRQTHRIGYFKRGSHEIVEAASCPILAADLQKTLENLRENLDWENFWAERIELEAATDGQKVSVFSDELIEPTAELCFKIGDDRYFYDARSFFQGNPFLVESLVETALGETGGRHALDLYCGVGLFTLPLARRFEKVVGIESNERSIASAEKNIEQARVENAEVFAEDVGVWLAENHGKLSDVDLVLLDPPRAGADRETIAQILKVAPSEISYVSCDPSTLARDLKIFGENDYRIEKITALDLFPQTHHVETVVRLKLN